jgi:hypothetical protein
VNPPRCKTRRRLNALSVAQMMVAMQEEAHTVHELCALVGLSLATTRHYILTLHREGGCHIEHWEQDCKGRHVTPSYRLGKRKDAIKPRRTRAESGRAYRAKKAMQEVTFLLAA